MPSTNIDLTEKQAQFIHDVIQDGRFKDTGEVVRAGLHLLALQEKQDQIKLELLQKLTQEGLDDIERGNFETVTRDSLKEYMDSVEALAHRQAMKK